MFSAVSQASTQRYSAVWVAAIHGHYVDMGAESHDMRGAIQFHNASGTNNV